jgi:hypothetical protein
MQKYSRNLGWEMDRTSFSTQLALQVASLASKKCCHVSPSFHALNGWDYKLTSSDLELRTWDPCEPALSYLHRFKPECRKSMGWEWTIDFEFTIIGTWMVAQKVQIVTRIKAGGAYTYIFATKPQNSFVLGNYRCRMFCFPLNQNNAREWGLITPVSWDAIRWHLRL